MVTQIDAPVLHQMIASGQDMALLDVREPWEYAHAHIAGSVNIPLSGLVARIDEIRQLQAERQMAVICHHGTRSQNAALFLAAQGFATLLNLRGGIHAWSSQVDPSVPVY